jgi:hypothetical protein
MALETVPRSFHVLIRAKDDPTSIEAPVWLATKEEAEAFARASIKVLSWYVWLDAFKISPTDVVPTHLYHDGELIRLKRLQ